MHTLSIRCASSMDEIYNVNGYFQVMLIVQECTTVRAATVCHIIRCVMAYTTVLVEMMNMAASTTIAQVSTTHTH